MNFATWIAFVIAGIVIAISPGSGAVLSMSHGLAYGLKKASATVLGLQIGLILVLADRRRRRRFAAAGFRTGLHRRQDRRRAVPDLARHRPVARESRAAARRFHRGPEPPTFSFGKRVMTGFLTNATNPKGIIFMVAVLPQFISKDAPCCRSWRSWRDHGHHRFHRDARLRRRWLRRCSACSATARRAHAEPLLRRRAGGDGQPAVLVKRAGTEAHPVCFLVVAFATSVIPL
jgi:hypothetical protein